MIAPLEFPDIDFHLRLMSSPAPETWVHYPYLPLVSRTRHDELGFPQLGLLVDFQGCWDYPGWQTTVFLMNLFMLGHEVPSLDVLAQLPTERYASFAAICQAGWRVD